ncbi:MAG: lysylphosphatidylglycerol synthase transmembrane domain-containing protein, partial [Actinomycetota bacterium]
EHRGREAAREHRGGVESDRSGCDRSISNRSLTLSVVSIALLVVVAVSRRQDLAASLYVLRGSAPAPLLVAAVLSLVGVVNRAGQFRAAHHLAAVETDYRSMARISAASYALNKVVKTGGVGGVALVVRHGRRRGLSTGGVLAACVINSLSSQLAMGAMIVVALVSVLATSAAVGSWTAAGAAVVGFVLLGLPTAGAVCLRSRAAIERSYVRLIAGVNRLAARVGLTGTAEPDLGHLDRFYATIETVRERPVASVPVLVHAVAGKLVGAAVLAASLAAVGADVDPATALLIYVLALLAAASTVLPGGLGAVEATMTLLLAGYGVPPSVALAGTLLFRLLDLWFPVVVGLVVAPGLDRSTARSVARAGPADGQPNVAAGIGRATPPALPAAPTP